RLGRGSGGRLAAGKVAGAGRVRDLVDRPAEDVGVEDVSVRPLLEVDRVRRADVELLDLRRVGQAVRADRHEPDALPGVVREEQAVVVEGRIVARAGVEREAGDRRVSGRTAVAGDDVRGVVVREVRGGRRAGAVERRAEVQAGALVPGLRIHALVARPAEVQ